MRFSVIFLLCLLKFVNSHSWLACTDYTQKNGRYWRPQRCRGFARDSEKYARKYSFGHDRMFDHRPNSNGGDVCKTKYRGNSYSPAYPKAVYFPGQQVILVHPMKNHGADYCTNQYIPDTANFVYRGRKNTDRDRKLSFYSTRVVADLGVSVFGYNATKTFTKYPKPGYQNAPAFCQDTEKAMGTYSFNVPEDIEAGEYTFVWRWSFNSIEETYTTCFDVIVTQDKVERDRILRERGMKLNVICGGLTSNLTPGSKAGCPVENKTSSNSTRNKEATSSVPTTTSLVNRPAPTPKPAILIGEPVYFHQLAGEIDLKRPKTGVRRRYVSVKLICEGIITFWNARKIGQSGDTYKLLQKNPRYIRSQKIYFSAAFYTPCDLKKHPPIAILTRDE